eukprot:905859-Prymnesium_polylepis.1
MHIELVEAIAKQAALHDVIARNLLEEFLPCVSADTEGRAPSGLRGAARALQAAPHASTLSRLARALHTGWPTPQIRWDTWMGSLALTPLYHGKVYSQMGALRYSTIKILCHAICP